MRSTCWPLVPLLAAAACAPPTNRVDSRSAALSPPAVSSWQLAYSESLGKLVDTVRNPFPLVDGTAPPYPARSFGAIDGGANFLVTDDATGNQRLVFLLGDGFIQDLDGTCSDGTTALYGNYCLSNQFLDPPTFTNELTMPAALPPKLHYYQSPSGPFLPFQLQQNGAPIDLGCNDGPMDGMFVNGQTYVFFVTNEQDPSTCSGPDLTMTVAHTQHGDDFAHMIVDTQQPALDFQRVSVSLDPDGQTVWIFGAGDWGASKIWLAKSSTQPANPAGGPPQFTDRSHWSYWNGSTFVADESQKAPIAAGTDGFDDHVAYLSARYQPQIGAWLLLYGDWNSAHAPADGFWLQVASTPAGAWSPPQTLFQFPQPANCDGTNAHCDVSRVGYDDGVSSYGFQYTNAAPYGAFLIPQYFTVDTGTQDAFSIYYIIETWNPGVPVLLHSELVLPGASAPPHGAHGVYRALANPLFADGTTSGWTQTGTPFLVVPSPDGPGNAVWTGGPINMLLYPSLARTGELYQDFTVGPNKNLLTFETVGVSVSDAYHCSVQLIRTDTGDVLRRSWPNWNGCYLDSDCNSGASCVNGSCSNCSVSSQCADGQTCECASPNQNGRCLKAGAPTGTCSSLNPLHVEWQLQDYRGLPLRVLIADDSASCELQAWGFNVE